MWLGVYTQTRLAKLQFSRLENAISKVILRLHSMLSLVKYGTPSSPATLTPNSNMTLSTLAIAIDRQAKRRCHLKSLGAGARESAWSYKDSSMTWSIDFICSPLILILIESS